MTLLEPHNLPFAVAFGALFVIGLLQVIGVGDALEGAGDFDIDVDSGNALSTGGVFDSVSSVLGIGRVPLLIWLSSLLFVFALTGTVGQALIDAATGAPLSAGIAAILAAGAALPLNGIVTRPLEKLLPKDETSAVDLRSLVRRDARIQVGTARVGSPARAKVEDVHGHPHFVMVEPHDTDAALSEGETVLLVRREGELFYAVRYESPLLTP